MRIEGCCCMLKSVEFGGWEPGAAKDVAWT